WSKEEEEGGKWCEKEDGRGLDGEEGEGFEGEKEGEIWRKVCGGEDVVWREEMGCGGREEGEEGCGERMTKNEEGVWRRGRVNGEEGWDMESGGRRGGR
ncbi:hypothetical protein KI387_040932, partial [Taxus chinensis]